MRRTYAASEARHASLRSRSRRRAASLLQLVAAVHAGSDAPAAAIERQAVSTCSSSDATSARPTSSASRHASSSALVGARREASCKALLEAAGSLPAGDQLRGAPGPLRSDDSGPPALDGLLRCARVASGVVPAFEQVLTHTLLVTGPVTWCRTCGAYSHARSRGILRRCPGPPVGRGGSGRTSLRRLLAGRHPRSDEALEVRALSLRAPAEGTSGRGALL